MNTCGSNSLKAGNSARKLYITMCLISLLKLLSWLLDLLLLIGESDGGWFWSLAFRNLEMPGGFAVSHFLELGGWKVDCSGFKKEWEEKGRQQVETAEEFCFVLFCFNLNLKSCHILEPEGWGLSSVLTLCALENQVVSLCLYLSIGSAVNLYNSI